MKYRFWMIMGILLTLVSCDFTKRVISDASSAIKNANAFDYREDIKLGKQVRDNILSDSKKYPVLDRGRYSKVYNYVENLKQVVLNSGNVKYRSEFPWEITIINDDKTLNAFATPGGYIFIYTGLIKTLDSEHQLLGVLGHEMAHADLRHSTRQITKIQGLSMMSEAIFGEPGAIEQIAGMLANLKFSRNHEEEADQQSVKYLCNTKYNSSGAADFFIKMRDQPTPPEFLSTHPDPADRVQDIHSLSKNLNCSGTTENRSEYQKIKNLLP